MKAAQRDPEVTREVGRAHGLTDDEFDRMNQILERQATFTELGLFMSAWSEHCSYKSSRRYLKTLPTKGPRIVMGPGENAGVVDIGESYTDTLDIKIPDGIEGDFYVIAFTDSAAQKDRIGRPSDIGFQRIGLEFEQPGLLAPWDLASEAARSVARGKVKEYQDEGNNVTAVLLPIILTTPSLS